MRLFFPFLKWEFGGRPCDLLRMTCQGQTFFDEVGILLLCKSQNTLHMCRIFGESGLFIRKMGTPAMMAPQDPYTLKTKTWLTFSFFLSCLSKRCEHGHMERYLIFTELIQINSYGLRKGAKVISYSFLLFNSSVASKKTLKLFLMPNLNKIIENNSEMTFSPFLKP